jgi:hypothetical protein
MTIILEICLTFFNLCASYTEMREASTYFYYWFLRDYVSLSFYEIWISYSSSLISEYTVSFFLYDFWEGIYLLVPNLMTSF